MDLVKYIIVGIGCLFVGLVLMILVRNIFAGLGFAFIGFLGYILWNFFNSVKRDESIPTADEPKDN